MAPPRPLEPHLFLRCQVIGVEALVDRVRGRLYITMCHGEDAVRIRLFGGRFVWMHFILKFYLYTCGGLAVHRLDTW